MTFAGTKVKTLLFTLIVGASSDSRKGQAINLMRAILDDATASKAVCDKPASKEALHASVANSPRTLLLYDEFGAFLAAAESGPMLAIKTDLNSYFDGIPVGNNLAAGVRMKKSATVKDPRLSFLGGCDPFYLERHSETIDWTSGFFARFFTINAARERFLVMPTDDPHAKFSLTQRLQRLIAPYTIPSPDGALFPAANIPPCLGLDAAATSLYTAWAQNIEVMKRDTRYAPALIRAPSFVHKIATLLALDMRQVQQKHIAWFINEEEMASAIRIVQLHVKSIADIGDLLSATPQMRNRRAVLAAINEHPTPLSSIITRAQLIKRDLMPYLDSLCDERKIERVSMPETSTLFYQLYAERAQVSTSPSVDLSVLPFDASVGFL